VREASPRTTARFVCYCDDCQAYAHHLGRADLLDAHGGTDVVQVAPAALTFEQGTDRIVGLRLAPKGLHRWYTSCCRTPIGNTLGPAVPFVGIVAQGFEHDGARADDAFGPPLGGVQGKFAVGGAPDGSTGLNVRLIARALRRILGWRLGGKAWPHPFFDRASRAPSHPVTVLAPAEREALRPLCGPQAVGRTA
jgi:hypothetical protein